MLHINKEHNVLRVELLLLPNTDHLQQVEEYVRGCTWQLTNVKTIYMFHELVFDRENSGLKCFNWATNNYELWQPVPVRYQKNIPVFVESYYEG